MSLARIHAAQSLSGMGLAGEPNVEASELCKHLHSSDSNG